VRLGDIQSGPFSTLEPEQSSWIAARMASAAYRRGAMGIWVQSTVNGGATARCNWIERSEMLVSEQESGQSGGGVKLR